jgi:hypothetical protein
VRRVERSRVPVPADALLHWSVRAAARILGELDPDRAALVMIKHHRPPNGRPDRLKMSLHGSHFLIELTQDESDQALAIIRHAGSMLLSEARPFGPQRENDHD